uniref:LisH domain-containing protein n=1 Tax=Rhabditophanes sp. KR3021 TaxID=114890 RepID=A0AC35U593_9BILA
MPVGQPVFSQSEAQSKERLASYVYDYLQQTGAMKAAEAFKVEFLQITPGIRQLADSDQPNFLQNWWMVFWDLYCAAPERRDVCETSQEAKAFHEYGITPHGQMPPHPSGMGNLPMHPPVIGQYGMAHPGMPGPDTSMSPAHFQQRPNDPAINGPQRMPIQNGRAMNGPPAFSGQNPNLFPSDQQMRPMMHNPGNRPPSSGMPNGQMRPDARFPGHPQYLENAMVAHPSGLPSMPPNLRSDPQQNPNPMQDQRYMAMNQQQQYPYMPPEQPNQSHIPVTNQQDLSQNMHLMNPSSNQQQQNLGMPDYGNAHSQPHQMTTHSMDPQQNQANLQSLGSNINQNGDVNDDKYKIKTENGEFFS